MQRTMEQRYLSEHGVADGAEVDGAFVGQIVENVEGSGGFGSLLLVSEDQIDPLVQLAGHKLALKGLQMEERAEDREQVETRHVPHPINQHLSLTPVKDRGGTIYLPRILIVPESANDFYNEQKAP